MNFFQRRLAYLSFIAILWKWSHPESSWLQVALYGVIGFALWQLRAAVYQACLERLKPPIYVFLSDAACMLIALWAITIILALPFWWEFDLPLVFGLAGLSFYRYRKTRQSVMEAIERMREQQARREAEQGTAEQE